MEGDRFRERETRKIREEVSVIERGSGRAETEEVK